jgi:hypothetical protein
LRVKEYQAMITAEKEALERAEEERRRGEEEERQGRMLVNAERVGFRKQQLDLKWARQEAARRRAVEEQEERLRVLMRIAAQVMGHSDDRLG